MRALLISVILFSSYVHASNPDFEDDQRAIIAAIQSIEVSEKDGIKLERFQGGLSGARLYRVYAGQNEFVARFGGDFISSNFKHEANVASAASEHGFGPRVFYTDTKKKLTLMECVDNDWSISRTQSSFHALVARHLSVLHGLQLPITKKDIFEYIKEFRADVTKKGIVGPFENNKDESFFWEKLETVAQIFRERFSTELRAVHHDLNPGNILVNNTKIAIIDWESVSLDFPMVDLAVFANFYIPDPTHIDPFLKAYYGDHLNEIEICKFNLIRPFAQVWHAYGLVKLSKFKECPSEVIKLDYLDFQTAIKAGKVDLSQNNVQLALAYSTANDAIKMLRQRSFQKALETIIQ